MGGNNPWRLQWLWVWGLRPAWLIRVMPSLICRVVPAVVEQVKLQTLQFRSGRLQLQESKGKPRPSVVLLKYIGSLGKHQYDSNFKNSI